MQIFSILPSPPLTAPKRSSDSQLVHRTGSQVPDGRTVSEFREERGKTQLPGEAGGVFLGPGEAEARGFPGSSVVKKAPADGGDAGAEGLILGPGRSPGRGNGDPLQYSCLEGPMDRGAWRATVHIGSQRVRHN